MGRDEKQAPLKTPAWEVIFTLETGDSRETGYPFDNFASDKQYVLVSKRNGFNFK